jgi:hypothetical protein
MAVKLQTFELTPEACRRAYQLLCETPPFNGWGLPDSSEITFKITRSRSVCGHYREWTNKRKFDHHEIAISTNCVGTLATLIMIMAHEIIHLYQAICVPRTDHPRQEHNEHFRRLADEVVVFHHWDRKLFAEID